MRHLNHRGIPIHANILLTDEEIIKLADKEISEWNGSSKPLGSITLDIEADSDGEHVVIFPHPVIKRVRRITGYLSNLDNFNDAKKAEEDDRFKHVGTEKVNPLFEV